VAVELTSETRFTLTIDAIRQTVLQAKATGSSVKSLLIVNPVNPLGCIYDAALMADIADFCLEHDLHLVVDEIYALSVFTNEPHEFKSIWSLPLPEKMRDSIHWLWGFSKDFCVNGFRAGVVASKNPSVIKGLKELSYFTGISTLMQTLLQEMLQDSVWNQRFIDTNAARLLDAYRYVTTRLTDFNAAYVGNGTVPSGDSMEAFPIRFLPAQAGFFLWVDFSHFLSAKTVLEERRLFLKFIQEGNVYIAPGQIAFHAQEPGWFRIIFAARTEILALAFDRIFSVLLAFNKTS
jgi:aspartate/methionine/tyrosine aminotransferase